MSVSEEPVPLSLKKKHLCRDSRNHRCRNRSRELVPQRFPRRVIASLPRNYPPRKGALGSLEPREVTRRQRHFVGDLDINGAPSY